MAAGGRVTGRKGVVAVATGEGGRNKKMREVSSTGAHLNQAELKGER